MDASKSSKFIREDEIAAVLAGAGQADTGRVREIFQKALQLKGLGLVDVAILTRISDPGLLDELFRTAKQVKSDIYGNRLVVFAPMYISNMCANDCLYCAFRAKNHELKRRALTQEEIAQETLALIEQGHKRVLMVAGESYPQEGFNFILKSIETIYNTTNAHGEIRRVNVNIAPLEIEEFKALKDAKIGTFQAFQETYHRATYAKVHCGGKKRDYDYRVTVMDRAMAAGIEDVGIGILFGLTDWRFEILALMQHIHHLEEHFGIGPHTISVPRLEPASGSDIAEHPPKPVSDIDFRKIVAILRLAVPYTGIIMSTRETPNIRRESFAVGVSQISAGSRTNPGGYAIPDVQEEEGEDESGQFSLGDHRPLDEVVRDVATLGYIPSFCTACYRLGRTGHTFMELARPGEIKHRCDPNALATFREYLLDFASPLTCQTGELLIAQVLSDMPPDTRATAQKMLAQVESGKRDVFL